MMGKAQAKKVVAEVEGAKSIGELKVMQRPVKYNVEIVRGEPDHIGVPVSEDLSIKQMKDTLSSRIGYEVDVEVDEDPAIIFMPLRAQSNEVNPDVYYPVVEWRITKITLDEADSWPEWKAFRLMDDGRPVYGDVGEELKVWYYIIISTPDDMEEEDDGKFFGEAPFMSTVIRVANNGMAVIKGQSILDRASARKTLAGDPLVGAARRRG